MVCYFIYLFSANKLQFYDRKIILVGRMIKYTGYGNAAGHFANRGLLGAHKMCSENSQYSSDSEDSDTEEYLAMRHTVNPVTGCYEPPRIDPMAGCSEEQVRNIVEICIKLSFCHS